MPTTRTSKLVANTASDLPLIDVPSDPLKYNDSLVRRFTTTLNERDVSSKGQRKSKKALDPIKLAMSAANSSSQCLGNIARTGWKASDPSTMNQVSMNNVSSIVEVFRSSIYFLRRSIPKSVDTERVASSFIGKTVALELYDIALGLLWDMKPYIVTLYYNSDGSTPALTKAVKKQATALELTRYYPLLQYPMPPPTDTIIVELICASIVQSITSLTALLSNSLIEPQFSVDKFVLALEGSPLLHWIPICSNDQQDNLLSRSHKAIALTFNDTNVSSATLLKLRKWTLRCLLHKPTLDPDMFWLQATRYVITHGKNLHVDAASEIVPFFDSIISFAQGRENNKIFMSGSAYDKFCETVLILTQKGNNVASTSRIQDSIQGRVDKEARPSDRARHAVVFGNALNALEHALDLGNDHGVLESLQQCCATLSDDPTIFVDAGGNPKLPPCLEKLRRLCTHFIEEKKGSEALRKAILTFCDAFARGVEMFRKKLNDGLVTELYTCAIDSLCCLSKAYLIPKQPRTYADTYEYLDRAAAFIEFSMLSEAHLDYFTKLVKCVSGTLMNTAIALYHINDYSHAIRFLVLCCNLTNEFWDSLTASNKTSNTKLTTEKFEESLKYFKSALTKRWELLGDCYSKTRDRKSAYQALLNALRFSPLEDLIGPSKTLHPREIFAQSLFKRTGSLIERITHMASFDLCLKERTSFHDIFISEVSAETLGLLLEYQVAVLEQGALKPVVKSIVDAILQDTLQLYDNQYPIRRARVLVWQLDFAYRIDDSQFSIDNVIPEILSLLSTSTSLGADQGLIHFRRQYETMTLMWNGLLIHQRSDLHYNGTATIIQQATAAVSILQELFLSHAIRPPTETNNLGKPLSVLQAPRVPRVATRSSPRKKLAIDKALPVTPKPRRKVLPTSPKRAEASSPKAMTGSSPTFAIDPRLVSIIDIFARMLGLLGHIPLKIRLLAILQQMATLSLESAANEFLCASADAATEYAKLGKNKRASAIFIHTLSAIDGAKPGVVSETVRILVLLGYAEVLALRGRVGKSVQLYNEARSLFQDIERNPSHPPTFGKFKNRLQNLELAARGAKVYALVNVEKGNPHRALIALRQSLKLWNRAYETLLKHTRCGNEANTNPFDMGPLTAALPTLDSGVEKETYRRNPLPEHINWRIAEGLFCALMDLADAYFLQGSVRGSEYLVEQARSLATAINSTNYVCRTITRMVDIHLHKGTLDDAFSSINAAMELVGDSKNINAANVARLSARYQQLREQDSEATSLYAKALGLMSDLSASLSTWEHTIPSSRKLSIGTPDGEFDIFVPDFQAAIFAQQIWLHRNEPLNVISELTRRLDALPSSSQVESEKSVILAKLALHQAYVKFRTDIFLSSLPESTIAIPMGLISRDGKVSPIGSKVTMDLLSKAQTYFQNALQRAHNGGKVTYAREAALSLATLRLFQASLGQLDGNDATVTINLLHASTALTLRRELVEAIEQKFPMLPNDDFVWPSLSDHDEDSYIITSVEDDDGRNTILKMYWNTIRTGYVCDHDLDTPNGSRTDTLPHNWTVVNISVADDKNAIFVSRQRADAQPLIFCIPIDRQGRKEEKDDAHFTFKEGIGQLKEILNASDHIAKAAKDVASGDRNGKVAWWAKRTALDRQLQDLLDNIEFCWLGAFKTILHEPRRISKDELREIADRIERVFQRTLVSEKKRIAQLELNLSVVECLSTLSPQCRQEELEDIVYFVLDLYQFHGIHIPLSEIDVDQIAVELRTVLEECAVKKFASIEDAHLFLILDKNVQEIPWESIPCLRSRSISRIPSLSFLLDRIELAKVQRQLKEIPTCGTAPGKALVDPRCAYFILNPSGDLEKSQARFEPWLKGMSDSCIGWKGVVGRKPSELEFIDALKKKDLVIYIGHGGAEQYIRSNKIKHLPRCAATMLWGCSSGLMHDLGDFDRHGTPYNYMIAGCPTLVCCLWDVTDNELDRFSQSVFDKLRLDPDNVRNWNDEGSVSVVTAVAESRGACKLKYLTGAAPVIYGIPFYL